MMTASGATTTEPDLYRTVEIAGPDGPVEARYHEAMGAQSAAVLVGGAGGGFDTPARGLYVRLGRHLPRDRIAVLRVRFRFPGDLAEARADVLAAIEWLSARGIERVGLVGHSFGGAVAIGAAAEYGAAAVVVTLATQSFGTDAVSRLRDVPVLLLHGTDDKVLPASSSLHVYRRAGPLAELRLLEGADHRLNGAAEEVFRLARAWLVDGLAGEPRPAAP